ncbi:MAG TPA: cupin domain-containing protein, partial [Candidatus Acidoferrales bacterium]|nr:cupin domain-containing protein [Candidatus Acidoferrales bacterium]
AALNTAAQTSGASAAKPTQKPATKPAMPAHPITSPGDLQWSPWLFGAQMAVVSGDPSKPGPFVIRLKAPAGTVIPPHFHPTTENVTILDGTFSVGMGDKIENAKMMKMESGAFASMPALKHHYAKAMTDTLVQVHGSGPFAITFVNPADDPRPKTQ